MLKLSTKRTHDMIMDEVPAGVPPPSCSPHRIQFLASPPSPPSPFKRLRTFPEVATGPTPMPTPTTSPSTTTSSTIRRKHARDDSPFVPSSPFNPQVTERFVTRKRVRSEEEERLYTLEEVKRIVAQVVVEREAALRQEYDQTLQRQLEEQFHLFSTFAHDNIARQMKESEATYIN